MAKFRLTPLKDGKVRIIGSITSDRQLQRRVVKVVEVSRDMGEEVKDLVDELYQRGKFQPGAPSTSNEEEIG